MSCTPYCHAIDPSKCGSDSFDDGVLERRLCPSSLDGVGKIQSVVPEIAVPSRDFVFQMMGWPGLENQAHPKKREEGGGVMEHWVSLETPMAYGLSVQDGTLAVACANGLVRLFRSDDLQYIATLPRPPPLGRANIKSIRELQEITDSAARVDEQEISSSLDCSGGGGGMGPSPDGLGLGPGEPLRYPAALGCRLSPSGSKIVCVYADRGLFIWDVTQPLCVGKYRSFLAHSSCIWDIQRMPGRPPPGGNENEEKAPAPDIPASAMVTCSADNTVRLWDLGALEGKGAGPSAGHSGRWSNIYSKHLMRVLYTDSSSNSSSSSNNNNNGSSCTSAGCLAGSLPTGISSRVAQGAGALTDADVDAQERLSSEATSAASEASRAERNAGRAQEENESPRPSSASQQGCAVAAGADPRAASGNGVLSEGVFDPETPKKPDCPTAPRTLAVHPDGSEVACGDKKGNIRVFSLKDMSLAHCQAAHEGEVLCLAYSPMLLPPASPRASSATPSTSPPSPPSPAGPSAEEDTGSSTPKAGDKGAGPYALAARGWRAIDPLDQRGPAGDVRQAHGSRLVGSGAVRCRAGHESGGSVRGEESGVEARPLVMLASGSRDRLVHVYDASAERRKDTAGTSGIDLRPTESAVPPLPVLTTLDNHSGSVTALKFSRDGTRLISAGGDKTLALNRVRGPEVQRLKTVSVPQGTVFGLDVDPTNKYFITAGQDKRLNIWSVSSGKHVRAYKVVAMPAALPSSPAIAASPSRGTSAEAEGGGDVGAEVFKVDLDPTGMYAAACSFDKWIRLFDFYSGKCLAKVAGHSELATGVRFTPDGRHLVSIGGDGVMFSWRLSDELRQAMRDRMCELASAGDGHAVAPGESGASDATEKEERAEGEAGHERFGTIGEVKCSQGGREAESDQQTAVSSAGARARAKAEAKARLRFQWNQLPSWAHTQESRSVTSNCGGQSVKQDPDEISSPNAADADSIRRVGDEKGGNGDTGDGRSPPPTPTVVRPPPPPSEADLHKPEHFLEKCELFSRRTADADVGAKAEPLAPKKTLFELLGPPSVGKSDGEVSGLQGEGQRAPGKPRRSWEGQQDRTAAGTGTKAREFQGAGARRLESRWGRPPHEEARDRSSPHEPLEILGRAMGRDDVERHALPAEETNSSPCAVGGSAEDPARSKEEQDGVMMCVSGDETDEADLQGYSLDDDFEDPGNSPPPTDQGRAHDTEEGAADAPTAGTCVRGDQPASRSADEMYGRESIPQERGKGTDAFDAAPGAVDSTALTTAAEALSSPLKAIETGRSPLNAVPPDDGALPGGRVSVSSGPSFRGAPVVLRGGGAASADARAGALVPTASTALDHREDSSDRGRRIIETEGVVETMRRRLSAMGFFEPDPSSDGVRAVAPRGVLDEDDPVRVGSSFRAKNDDPGARSAGKAPANEEVGDLVVGSTKEGDGGSDDVDEEEEDVLVAFDALCEASSHRGSTTSYPSLRVPNPAAVVQSCLAPASSRRDEGPEAINLSTGVIGGEAPAPQSTERGSGATRFISSGPSDGQIRMTADTSAAGPNPAADDLITPRAMATSASPSSSPPESTSPTSHVVGCAPTFGAPDDHVDADAGEADYLPADIRVGDDAAGEADVSTLSSGPSSVGTNAREEQHHRRRQRRRRNLLRGLRDESGSSSRGGILPRSDEEYENALSRLTEAAAHAADLFRELTEASASLSTGGDVTRAGTTSSPSPPAVRFLHAREAAGSADDSSCAGGKDAGDDGAGDAYEDDEDWNDADGRNGAGAEPSVGQTRGPESGALLLERSFRESFLSVNSVLSTIAGRADTPARLETRSFNDANVAKNCEAGSIPEGRARVSPSGAPTTQLPPKRVSSPDTLSTSRTGCGPRSSGGLEEQSATEVAKQTRSSLSWVSTPHGDSGGRRNGVTEMPREISNMLHRYSEMMLNVVQEKIQERLADGTMSGKSGHAADN